MTRQSAADDSFTKKFLMNISSNFCKRRFSCQLPLLQLFANLSFYYIFLSGWGGRGVSDWGSGSHVSTVTSKEKPVSSKS